MKDNQIPFIHPIEQNNNSPWTADSKLLVLANTNTNIIDLETYHLFWHRDQCGDLLGIEFGTSLYPNQPVYKTAYLSGENMFRFLLQHVGLMERFCSNYFVDEFKVAFGTTPEDYFKTAESNWQNKLQCN